MRLRPIAALLIASIYLTQMPGAFAQAPATPPIAVSSLSVPAGTVIPLTLVTPIMSKSTKPGDTIRAVVAFPVTVGNQIAIPVGTYVDGTLDPPAPKSKTKSKVPQPPVHVHFTKLLFANGYTVAFDSINTAVNEVPAFTTPQRVGAVNVMMAQASVQEPYGGPSAGEGYEFADQSLPPLPPLPPLPQIGPSKGEILGIIGGRSASSC